MKIKALLTAVLLATSNLAWAQGGLTIDNVRQHMNAQNWADTQTGSPAIVVQGPIDQFEAYSNNRRQYTVETSQLKHSYDGQS